MTSTYPIESTGKGTLIALRDDVILSSNFKFKAASYKEGIFSWRYDAIVNKHKSIFLNAPDIVLTLNEKEIAEEDREIVIEIINNGNLPRRLSLLAGFLDRYISGKKLVD